MQFPNNDNENRNDPNQPEGSPEPDWRRWMWPALLLGLVVWALFSSSGFFDSTTQGTLIDYSKMRDEIRSGNVMRVVIDGDTGEAMLKSPITVTNARGNASVQTDQVTFEGPLQSDDFVSFLDENNVDYRFNISEAPILLVLLFQFAPFILIIIFLIWMSRRAQGQMGNIFSFGRSQAKEYNVDSPRITFNDVAGQDAAKGELEEVVDYLREPDKYIALGAKVPKGVLLVGPPGTGKTLMARAVAGEANVPFFSATASEFVEMFVGVGASRVRDMFNRAKNEAPAIIFIDELDAVGRQRGTGLGGGHDEREQTLNQMLAEMDGFEQGTNVIVIAATNRPDVLDPALLRPGRFDRQITVDLPDREGRLSILKIHTRDKPIAEDVELNSLAQATIGFSGADLANLANEAALSAARNSRKYISMGDFTYSYERILLGTERPPLSNPEERRVVAFHEAGHALVAMLTKEADKVLKVTITPRGQALGITAMLPEDDRRNYSRKYLEAQLKVALGGRAAEEIVIGDITTGASNDLRRVTDMARRMVAQFGMSDAVGPLNFGEHDAQPFLGYSLSQGRNYSEETASKIDVEVRKIVDHAYEDTYRLLSEHRKHLDQLAAELLEHEVVERERVIEILQLNVSEAELEKDHHVPETEDPRDKHYIDVPSESEETPGD